MHFNDMQDINCSCASTTEMNKTGVSADYKIQFCSCCRSRISVGSTSQNARVEDKILAC